MINGLKEPPFWVGVVEDRQDPLKVGRVRVRVIGLHTHDKTVLPTADLPWAYCVQPIHSASLSGIGQAPVGPVEGTWVAIQYLDQDKQRPFVTGALPGISQDAGFFDNAPSQGGNYKVEEDGQVKAPWTDYDNKPIGEGSFAYPGSYETSQDMIDKIKQKEGFRGSVYQDVAGIWTIGYGTTFIDGIRVGKNTPPIDEARGEELLKQDVKLFEVAVKVGVRVPITQSMFDAMVSLTYNIGPAAFRSSSVVREINEGNYDAAADAFRMWKFAGGQVVAGLEARREEERSWFLREGTEGEVGQPASDVSKTLAFGSAGGQDLDDETKQTLMSAPLADITKTEMYLNT
jgi:lysozyme